MRTDYTLLPLDPHRTIRSLAAKHGFCDPHFRGELDHVFSGKGRSIRYLRRTGVSLDRFGELLADHGVTSRRLTPAEVADLLSATFDSRPQAKVAKPPSRAVLKRAEEKARKMRNRKFACDRCHQIARASRNAALLCGLCFVVDGVIVPLKRVDPLPEEIAERMAFA